MNIIEFLWKYGSPPKPTDEMLYEFVASELASSIIRQGLWTKALADARWHEPKAKSLYVNMRVAQLRSELLDLTSQRGSLSSDPVFGVQHTTMVQAAGVPKNDTDVIDNGSAAWNKNPSERCWSEALAEFEGTARRPGVWAKVLAESAGNEGLAKAEYLRVRAHELHAASVAAEDGERQRQLQQAQKLRQEEERQRQEKERQHAATMFAILSEGEYSEAQITAACEAYLSALGFEVKVPTLGKWQIFSPKTGTTYAYSAEDLRKRTEAFALWVKAERASPNSDGTA